MNTSNDLIYKITVTIDKKELQNVDDWLTMLFGVQLSKENINGIWRYFTFSSMTMYHPEIKELEVGFINKIDAMAFVLRWT